MPLFRRNVVKKYQTSALQLVEKSADNDDHFDYEMSTSDTLLAIDKRNKVISKEIIFPDPIEEKNTII